MCVGVVTNCTNHALRYDLTISGMHMLIFLWLLHNLWPESHYIFNLAKDTIASRFDKYIAEARDITRKFSCKIKQKSCWEKRNYGADDLIVCSIKHLHAQNHRTHQLMIAQVSFFFKTCFFFSDPLECQRGASRPMAGCSLANIS